MDSILKVILSSTLIIALIGIPGSTANPLMAPKDTCGNQNFILYDTIGRSDIQWGIYIEAQDLVDVLNKKTIELRIVPSHTSDVTTLLQWVHLDHYWFNPWTNREQLNYELDGLWDVGSPCIAPIALDTGGSYLGRESPIFADYIAEKVVYQFTSVKSETVSFTEGSTSATTVGGEVTISSTGGSVTGSADYTRARQEAKTVTSSAGSSLTIMPSAFIGLDYYQIGGGGVDQWLADGGNLGSGPGFTGVTCVIIAETAQDDENGNGISDTCESIALNLQ